MNSRHFAFLVLITSACFLQGCMLHRSACGVRGALLKQTPVGTHYGVVEAYVKSKGWHWQSSSWGKEYQNFKSNYIEVAVDSPTNAVSKAMGAYLGDWGVLPVSQRQVSGYWLFDLEDELIDICIFKRLISL